VTQAARVAGHRDRRARPSGYVNAVVDMRVCATPRLTSRRLLRPKHRLLKATARDELTVSGLRCPLSIGMIDERRTFALSPRIDIR
jgi:hypothetical protein